MRITNFSTPFFFVLVSAIGILGLFPTALVAQDIENSLLWRIEGNGAEPSHLYGTVHVLPQADFELKSKVTKAFSSAKLIVMELDMSNPNLQMEMMQYAPMTEGHTLDQLFSQTDYRVLDSIMTATVGMGLGMLNTFKPFVISSFLLGRLIEGQPASFEGTFVQMASAGGLKVVGLETVAEQMAVFDDISYESQAEDVLEMVYQEAEMKAFYTEMIGLYREEQIGALYNMTVDYFGASDEVALLLNNRNKNWIAPIEVYLRESPTFIAVGAAHLGGDLGLITLLREAGYTVTPVF